MLYENKIRKGLRAVYYRWKKKRNTFLYGNCAVLLYHRVAVLSSDPQQLAVHPDRFKMHLKHLKSNYRVLSVEEFTMHLTQRKKFPENSILLTFDDGYEDNYLFAKPLLEQEQLQALFYISSGYIDQKREFWWDELERILLVNSQLPEKYSREISGVRVFWDKNNGDSVKQVYDNLCQELRTKKSEEREKILEVLRTELNSPTARDSHLPMSEEQLRLFSESSSVEIGAHTVLHPSLAALSDEEQREEIVSSREALKRMTGKSINWFSYPFGTGADFNATSINICREAGFAHAAANFPDIVHSQSPQFCFPRFLVRDWDEKYFINKVKEFLR